jgi:23S rRNA (cytidine1920-2'-O)/16S rRNA (cytidine1409-2'-O)-methyltransferase
VASKKRASFVALPALLQRRFSSLADPYEAVTGGRVLVDGAPITNPASRVRADASLRLLSPEPLRGTRKLEGALEAFGFCVRGAVALDLGAAAGGFTQALLDAGAARVYAVDAGSGQLRGRLRADARVVSLERTNLSVLTRREVVELVDVVVMDLSYLAVADALPQLDPGLLSASAQLVVLVKPTYELHAPTLAADPVSVSRALARVQRAMVQHGWSVVSHVPSPITGSRGAVEVFVHAARATPRFGQARGRTYTRATPSPTPNDRGAAG